MSAKLSQFLIELASDARRLDNFLADPRAALDTATLSRDERKAVLAGDSARLRQAFGAGAGGKGGIRKTRKGKGKRKSVKKQPARKKVSRGRRSGRR